MSATEIKQTCTPEELLKMPDGDLYELVDGELVERHMGCESSWIGCRLCGVLSTFCDSHQSGWVLGADASFQCFPDSPGKVRKPDGSFIRLGRLANEKIPTGHCPIAPDLAIEVVSPHDSYSEVEEKVDEYLAAGVLLVWVIDPPTRTVRVHRHIGSLTDLGLTDELNGEQVLPGFRLSLSDLFKPPMANASST